MVLTIPLASISSTGHQPLITIPWSHITKTCSFPRIFSPRQAERPRPFPTQSAFHIAIQPVSSKSYTPHIKKWTSIGCPFSSLCWHYLFSRPVTRQVSSAHVSLTSVFGMGTGEPSQQSTPTHSGRLSPSSMSKPFSSNSLLIIVLNPSLVKHYFLRSPSGEAQRSGSDVMRRNKRTFL